VASNETLLDAIPLDLLAILTVVSIAQILVYYVPPWLTPLRVVFGLVSVLFAPGYVTLAAVTARADVSDALNEWEWVGTEVSRWEYALLSVVTSIVVVPLLGLLVSLTPLGIRPPVMVFVVSSYTVVVAVLGAVRRLLTATDAEARSGVAIGAAIDRLRAPRTGIDTLLNVSIVLLVLVGVVAVVTPLSGEPAPGFTEFSLLTENGSGELAVEENLSVADSDGSFSLVAGITNRERRSVGYTLLVQVQRADVRERSVAVLERRAVSTTTVEIGSGERARIPYEITLDDGGAGCRIAFLLYRGDVPTPPTIENAYRELHLWSGPDAPNRTNCRSLDAIDVETNRSSVRVSEDS